MKRVRSSRPDRWWVWQDAQRPFLMVLEVFGCDHRDGQYLRVWYLRKLMAAMLQMLQQRVVQDKGGYNPFGVHRFLVSSDFGVATRILQDEVMGIH